MTDEPTKLDVEISFPDKWLISHWRCYQNAVNKFKADQRLAGNATPDNDEARYLGGLALLKAQHVRVKGVPGLDEAVAAGNSDTTPLEIVAFVVYMIAREAEKAFDFPLAWIPSSATTTNQNGSTPQPN